jgi:hypothetical protein
MKRIIIALAILPTAALAEYCDFPLRAFTPVEVGLNTDICVRGPLTVRYNGKTFRLEEREDYPAGCMGALR